MDKIKRKKKQKKNIHLNKQQMEIKSKKYDKYNKNQQQCNNLKTTTNKN